MAKSSSKRVPGTGISSSSASSVSFQPTTTLTKKTNTSTRSPTSKKSTSENGSISESRFFIDDDSSDKNGVENDEISNLETCNTNNVQNDSEFDSEDAGSSGTNKNNYASVKGRAIFCM